MSNSHELLTEEVISEFINAMLSSELPIDALELLIGFLKIEDASASLLDLSSEKTTDLTKKSSDLSTAIQSLSKSCRTELQRAQTYSETAERVAKSHADEISLALNQSPSTWIGPIVPPTISHRLQESMQHALMKLMEERDISHARLAAAEVMHVHELDQQKKMNDRLGVELEGLRAEKVSPTADQERAQRQRQMQQSSDEELMSLCQQLAGEISARTASTLEVERLKDIRKMDVESHESEVKSLKDQINHLKMELEAEKAKVNAASSEISGWKRSYEDAIDRMSNSG